MRRRPVSRRTGVVPALLALLGGLAPHAAVGSDSPGEGIVTSGERGGAIRLPELGVSLVIGGFVELNTIVDDPDASLSSLFSSRALDRDPNRASRFSLDGRDTRLNLDVRGTRDGDQLRLFVEGDFDGSGGNEIATNSYSVRLRHAFADYGPWRVGQYWSALVDTEASPSTIDPLAPVGRPFVRQAGIRHEWGGGERSTFGLAIENPESDVQDGDGSRLPSTDSAPDLHAYARRSFDGGGFANGHLRLAGVARWLSVNLDGETARAPGYALSFSGSLGDKETLADNVTFSLSAGEGFARYIGERGGSGVDAVIVDGGTAIEAIPVVSGFVGYRHPWSARHRSSIVFGGLRLDAPGEAPGALIESGYSVSVNWLTDPVDNTTVGVELIHGERTDVSGRSADTVRGLLLVRASF